MKSKRSIIPSMLTVLFVTVIAVFTIFGLPIRNYFSPKVAYMHPLQSTATIESELWTVCAVPDEVILYDDSGMPFVWLIDEDEITGEKRSYAKKHMMNIFGAADGSVIDIKLMSEYKIIVDADREISENQRIVVVGLASMETEG